MRDDPAWRAGVSAAASASRKSSGGGAAAAAAATAERAPSSSAAAVAAAAKAALLRSRSGGQLILDPAYAPAAAAKAAAAASKPQGRSEGGAALGGIGAAAGTAAGSSGSLAAGRYRSSSSSSSGGGSSTGVGGRGAVRAVAAGAAAVARAPLAAATTTTAAATTTAAPPRPPAYGASGPFATQQQQQQQQRRTTSSSGGGGAGGGFGTSSVGSRGGGGGSGSGPGPSERARSSSVSAGGGGGLAAAAANAVRDFDRPLTTSLLARRASSGQQHNHHLPLPASLQPSRQPSFLIPTRGASGRVPAAVVAAEAAASDDDDPIAAADALLARYRPTDRRYASSSSSSSSSPSASPASSRSSGGGGARALARTRARDNSGSSSDSDVSELSESLRLSPSDLLLPSGRRVLRNDESDDDDDALRRNNHNRCRRHPTAPSSTSASPSPPPPPLLPLATPTRHPLPPGVVGLLNLGNTCFAGSVLQALFCVPAFTRSLALAAGGGGGGGGNGGPLWTPDASVAPALADLYRRMRRAGAPGAAAREGFGGGSEEEEEEDADGDADGEADGAANPAPPSTGPRLPLVPRALLAAMTRLDPRWGQGDQEDAHEFLRALLERLRDECNAVKEKPPYRELGGEEAGDEAAQAREAAEAFAAWQHAPCVDGVFGGMMQSTLTCLSCGHVSHRFEPFLDLCLPLPRPPQGAGAGAGAGAASALLAAPVPLSALLAAFMAPERLDGGERVRCDRCSASSCPGELRPAEKRQRVWSWPRALVVALKRFQGAGGGGFGVVGAGAGGWGSEGGAIEGARGGTSPLREEDEAVGGDEAAAAYRPCFAPLYSHAPLHHGGRCSDATGAPSAALGGGAGRRRPSPASRRLGPLSDLGGGNGGNGGGNGFFFAGRKNTVPVSLPMAAGDSDGRHDSSSSSSPDCALLDLSPHCAPRGLEEAAARGLPPPKYRLVSVVRHCGASLHGGHYTAVGRGPEQGGGRGGGEGGGGGGAGGWFARDDDLVWECAPPCAGGGGGGGDRDAYVLVFELTGADDD